MSRLLLIPILATLFTLSSPISTSAATECNVGNMSGLEVNGQCIYFTKGDDPHSAFGCSANNPSGYGVLQFPCPKELLKAYENKAAIEQEKVNAEREDNEQRAQEELDKKIREAVEEYAKEQEKVHNDQVVSTQTPAIAVPVVTSKPINPPVPVQITTKTITAPAPVKETAAEIIDSPNTSEPAPIEVVVPESEKKTSLWTHFSGFLSRLNPFGWFK